MTSTPTHSLLVGGRSDIGPRRRNNQDSGYADAQLLLIADGVGGSPAGDIASAEVVRRLTAALHRDPDWSASKLREQVGLANAQLARRGREDDQLRGMATTLTGLVVGGDQTFVIHVGDSRAYRWRAGVLEQITSDQSWIQMLLDQGLVSVREAARHPMRNMLLHSLSGSLGDPDAVQIFPVDLRIGDRWLLVTDGLSSYLPADLLAELTAEVAEPQYLADLLVEQAWAHSRDNISVVVGDVTFAPVASPGRFIGAALGGSTSAQFAV